MVYAIFMALLLESARINNWRLPVTQKEFNLISDVSSILFLCFIIYVFTTRSFEGIFTILSILPFLFYLLILAQAYSTRGNISVSTLFISLRKTTGPENDLGIDISYPYFFVCILAASAGNHHSLIFYLCISLLIALALWFLRPKYSNKAACIMLLLVTISLSYPAHQGLQYLQSVTESRILTWFERFLNENLDPNHVSTAIGSVGRLKLSDSIKLRVDTHGEKLENGLLLKEASYSNYGYGAWTNFDQTFRIIDPGIDGKHWQLDNQSGSDKKLTINYKLPDKKGILPVPHGTSAIDNFSALQVDVGDFGAVTVESRPGWIQYDAIYSLNNRINDTAPQANDLAIPNVYAKDLLLLANSLGLEKMAPSERLEAIERFFLENFSYSLTQTERYPRGKYLTKFLFETRKGHCEYFATATALLLRAGGIPSRYVIGYSIQEFSELENLYIARARHAHSWVLAWLDNKWVVVDTTPAVWAVMESSEKSGFEALFDIFSWLGYSISILGREDAEINHADLITFTVMLALVFYLIARFVKSGIVQKGRNQGIQPWSHGSKNPEPEITRKLFNQIEKKYQSRKTGQTLYSWVDNLQDIRLQGKLKDLLSLYYQYRFDPDSDAREKNRLNREATQILEDL